MTFHNHSLSAGTPRQSLYLQGESETNELRSCRTRIDWMVDVRRNLVRFSRQSRDPRRRASITAWKIIRQRTTQSTKCGRTSDLAEASELPVRYGSRYGPDPQSLAKPRKFLRHILRPDLTLDGHIKTAERRTIIQQYGDCCTGR